MKEKIDREKQTKTEPASVETLELKANLNPEQREYLEVLKDKMKQILCGRTKQELAGAGELETLNKYKKVLIEILSFLQTKEMKSGIDYKKFVLLDSLEEHRLAVSSVLLSQDGTKIFSSSYDKTIKMWDRATGECLKTMPSQNAIVSMALSQDGRQVIFNSWNTVEGTSVIRTWDVETNQVKSFAAWSSKMASIIESRDGQELFTLSAEGAICIWNKNTGENVLTWNDGVDDENLYGMIESRDGSNLITASSDKTVKIWDKRGNCQKSLVGHEGLVYTVAESHDGKQIISGDSNGIIKVWDKASGECVQNIIGHGNAVTTVIESIDGRHVISGSDDWTVQIWDKAGGFRIHILKPDKGTITSVVESPDGKQIIAGGNKAVMIFGVEE